MMARVAIAVKRAYDPVSRADGTRFLVERLWPRGISKAKLRVDAWLKEVGPSTKLRQWFRHDPEKWREFRRRYRRELDSRREAWQPIVTAAGRGPVTLVYSSHDTEHNNAVALQQYLEARIRRPSKATAADGAARRSAR
jgi:uncharacterized protein YeaO (DUF488 family)